MVNIFFTDFILTAA